MSRKFNFNRRHFLGAAAITLAAPQITLAGLAAEKSGPIRLADTNQMNHMANNSFETIKQINAGELNVGYAEAGPENGPVVILLHGWPYDIYSFSDVTPLLVSAGYRVIVPWLRGYGSTVFLSDKTFRNGQQSVLAVDIINLMDALKIKTAIIGGFDWGARTANIIAALWPERVKAMVSVSGYLIGNQEANKIPLPRPLNCSGGINFILQRTVAGTVMINTGTIFRNLSGRPLRLNGILMMRLLIKRQPLSVIRIMLPSSFTITAGALA